MDITQVHIWRPSTARPQPGRGTRFPAGLGRAVGGHQGRDHDRSGATARDQLAMISQLWSLYGIKGKIAAEVSGQMGNQPAMTLPSPQSDRSKITLDNLEASRSDCLAGFTHSRCDATPPVPTTAEEDAR